MRDGDQSKPVLIFKKKKIKKIGDNYEGAVPTPSSTQTPPPHAARTNATNAQN